MFFRDVVFGHLPASILKRFWLDLEGLGSPSCSHVGSSWVAFGLQIGFLVSLGRSWRLELVLNFNKSRFYSAGDRRCRPGGPPARFWRPLAVILEGLPEGRGLFVEGLFT